MIYFHARFQETNALVQLGWWGFAIGMHLQSLGPGTGALRWKCAVETLQMGKSLANM